MNNKYSAVMQRIELTDEMRERILNKIRSTDFSRIPIKNTAYRHKKILSLAACFLILFIGAVSISSFIKNNGDENIQAIPDIKELNSAEELSQSIGFEIQEAENIPFPVRSKTYISLWDEIAQITYSGETGTLVYRKSAESGDISGDYNTYDTEETLEVSGMAVTLKGSDGTYSLAVWQSGDYSYSITVSEGISQNEMISVIESCQ